MGRIAIRRFPRGREVAGLDPPYRYFGMTSSLASMASRVRIINSSSDCAWVWQPMHRAEILAARDAGRR